MLKFEAPFNKTFKGLLGSGLHSGVASFIVLVDTYQPNHIYQDHGTKNSDFKDYTKTSDSTAN